MIDSTIEKINNLLKEKELCIEYMQGDYRLEKIKYEGDLINSIQNYFGYDNNYSFEVKELFDWKVTIQKALKIYLAETRDDSKYLDFDKKVLDKLHRNDPNLTQKILDLLHEIFSNEYIIYELFITPKKKGDWLKPFYECSWNDFIFSNSKERKLFLFHLGISD